MNEFWQWFSEIAPKIGGRSITFRKMFEHLDRFKDPIIIETGCVRHNTVWTNDAWAGDGCSTIMFDKYVSLNGGCLYSVDIDYDNVQYARSITGKNSRIFCNDSVEFLKDYVRGLKKEGWVHSSLNLIYLDSGSSPSETETQVRHFNELKILMPKVTPDTLVVTDDSPLLVDESERQVISGRGSIINQYAIERGIEPAFSGYQAGWIGFHGAINTFEEILSKARKLTDDGKWNDAYPFYRKIYMLVRTNEEEKKVYGETCTYFARIAAGSDKYGTAHDWYRRALTADPLNIGYRLEMITRAMKPLGWLSVARLEAIKATEISSDNPVAWNVLGDIEADLKNHTASLAAYDKFIETSNRSTFSLLTKTAALIKNEQYVEAEVLCDEAILQSESLGAFACKAEILANLDEHERAIDYYTRILKHKDDSIIKHFLSLSLFSVGRHREGWRYSFQSRIENETAPILHLSIRRFADPLKQLFVMQPPPAIVHIHAESGEGDNIAMMRYLPLLVEKGYTVRYEVWKGALKIAQDSFSNVDVIPRASNFPGVSGLPDFDYHLPITDLPFMFQTDIDTIPWRGPYIKADPELSEKYKSLKGKMGIIWSTGPVDVEGYRYSRRKSISFDLLKPIIDVDPSMFVSLQAGPARMDNDRICDPMPKDERTLVWADTAAIINNLDLVITIDTSVAHLAGAMGKPTWLMMHKYLTSWQFMAECPGASWNTTSPWYPSMRIFRQKVRGNWDSVVSEVTEELNRKLGVLS